MRIGGSWDRGMEKALMILVAVLALTACEKILGPDAAKGPGITSPHPPNQPPPGALQITTTDLPVAMSGQPYVATLLASGGSIPYRWTVANGVLPIGLILGVQSGDITGTPTSPAGLYTFTVNLATPAGNVLKELKLEVQ